MALVFNTPKSAINTTSKDIQNLSSDCPPCPEVNLTTADVEYTENGEYTVTPEEGYDGLTQVDITVNIPSDVRNQDKLVTPTTSYQTITADSGYSGIGTVDVLPVTSSIDANITAGNIKKDVSILGVTGSYDPQPDLETKTVTYTTNDTYTITPTAGKDGMSSVEVTVNVTGSNCPDWSTIGWDCSDVTASSLVKDIIPNDNNYRCINGFYEQKITSTVFNYSHSNANYLRYLPIQDASYINNNSLGSSFSGCEIVDNVHFINTGSITNMSSMFNNCYSLTTFSFDDTSAVTDMSNMFAACVALTTVPMMDTSSVTNMSGMFSCGALRGNVGIYRYNKMHITTIPQFDTSNVINVSSMFFGGTYVTNDSLTTLPQLNFGKVERVDSMLSKCTAITTLGGFTNLGKSFSSSGTSSMHTLDLSSSTVLTKQSIMNVINNLAAPDDTAVTDASLKLSDASYALLDASDFAIATAKNWTVTSVSGNSNGINGEDL